MPDPNGDAAFRHLEELVASAEKPVKKKRDQKEYQKTYRANMPVEQAERYREKKRMDRERERKERDARNMERKRLW